VTLVHYDEHVLVGLAEPSLRREILGHGGLGLTELAALRAGTRGRQAPSTFAFSCWNSASLITPRSRRSAN
jgi:hypothetical protein